MAVVLGRRLGQPVVPIRRLEELEATLLEQRLGDFHQTSFGGEVHGCAPLGVAGLPVRAAS